MKEVFIILVITTLSVISSKRDEKIESIKRLISVFTIHLSYIVGTLALFCAYASDKDVSRAGCNHIGEVSYIIAYIVGRWAFLLDNKIFEFVKNNSLYEMILKIRGKHNDKKD